jgi:hypothetical protein
MRKPVVPRIFGLLGLYTLIFVVIVGVQFTKKGSFSLQTGDMLVEGQYRVLEEGESVPYDRASPLAGELSIFYGGLEFRLSGNPVSSRTDREGFLYLIDAGGNRYTAFPEYLSPEDGGLRFYLTGGVELLLSAPGEGGELRISGAFGDGIFTGLEIPYRPLKSSRVRDTGNSQFVIVADGRNYHFSRTGPEGRQVLVLQKGGLPVSYGIVGEEKVFKAEDYILVEAQEAYEEALARWVDRNYALWSRLIASRNDEDLVIAYQAEALRRGAFKTAQAAVSRNFLNGGRRSYESSVYLGGMVAAQRGFVTAEGDRLSRLTRLINENSADLLLESLSFEFLKLRNQENLMNQGIALIRNLDPASLVPAQIPGLLEALTAGLGLDEALVQQAQFVLSPCLKRLPPVNAEGMGLVLAFQGDSADIGWNLRLGKALADWGTAVNQAGWAAIGRSIVLSVLSLEDGEGRVIANLGLDGQGEVLPTGTGSIDAGWIYRLLEIGDYRPRALAISPAAAGLWTWTASPDVAVTQEGQILDLTVNFPLGESHYMLVRGVSPFYRLQFYNMDWRSDPQFERYDSSGWVYYPQDRILVLKVKHRSPVEHIRLYLGSPPPPAPVEPPPAEPEEASPLSLEN